MKTGSSAPSAGDCGAPDAARTFLHGGQPGGCAFFALPLARAYGAVVPPRLFPAQEAALARRTTARGVALAVLALTAGLGPLSVPAGADTAAGSTGLAAEKVFQSDRYVARGHRLYAAGPSGYLH